MRFSTGQAPNAVKVFFVFDFAHDMAECLRSTVGEAVCSFTEKAVYCLIIAFLFEKMNILYLYLSKINIL
jgi:hypothetical protein